MVVIVEAVWLVTRSRTPRIALTILLKVPNRMKASTQVGDHADICGTGRRHNVAAQSSGHRSDVIAKWLGRDGLGLVRDCGGRGYLACAGQISYIIS